MDGEVLSLCIPVYEYNDDKIGNRLWRIADFSQQNNEFVKLTDTDKSSNNHIYDKIFAAPKDISTFKGEIFSWQVVENIDNKNRIISSKYFKRPIEILKLEDCFYKSYNGDVNIRKILQNGISVHKYLDYEFLLIINQNAISFEVMHCNLKMFNNPLGSSKLSIDKTCRNMLRVEHNANIYSIDKLDIIDTNGVNIFYSKDEKAPIRYFYKKLDFPKPIRVLRLREFEDYAKAYVSRYIKNKKETLHLTNKEMKNIISVVEQAVNDSQELEVFFSETGFDIKKIKHSFSTTEDIVEEYLYNDHASQIVENALLNNKEVKQKFFEKAQILWLGEQNEIKSNVEKDIENTKLKLSRLEHQKSELCKVLYEQNAMTDELSDEINELAFERDNLKSEILKLKSDAQKELDNFQENVIKLASITALSKNNSGNIVNQDEILHIKGLHHECLEGVYADNLADFIDDLSDNLRCLGVNKKYFESLASYVVSSIVAKKQIIVCGGKSDVLANALSNLISKSDAEQLFLPAGFTNINAIVTKINSLDRKVVLLHNFIDTYNESVFSTIIKLCSDKILIFNCEDYQTYLNLPKHWSQYATYISIIDIFEKVNGEELLFGEFNTKVFNEAISLPNMKLDEDEIIKSMLSTNSLYLPNVQVLNEVYQISLTDELNSLDVEYFIIKNILIVNSHIASEFDFESVGINAKKQKKLLNGIVYE